MKKLFYLTLSLLLVFVLGACDHKEASAPEGEGTAIREGSKNKEAAQTQEAGETKDSAEKDAGSENASAAENSSGTENNDAAENKDSSAQSDSGSQNQNSGDNYSKPKHPTYKNDPNQEVIYIREKMFVAQTNDIYLNAKDYLGKKIKYEGMFKAYTDPRTNITYYSVIRYGPGCCGTDMNCGFEVIWLDGEAEYPEDDAWVEVEGVLGFVEGENGYKFLRLDMTSLKVLEKRGLETVLQ